MAVEDVGRFRRMRDIGAYLGLTPKRYQSGETDVVLGISRQGDAMARHYLYEAANVLLTTVDGPSMRKIKAGEATEPAATIAVDGKPKGAKRWTAEPASRPL